MRVPFIWHGAAELHHPGEDVALALQRWLGFAVQWGCSGVEHGDERVAPFGHKLNRVGVEELVIAERRRYGASTGRVFEASLGIVSPVAAGLKHVDANNVLLGEAGVERQLRVGPLELQFAARPLRRKAEMLLRGL